MQSILSRKNRCTDWGRYVFGVFKRGQSKVSGRKCGHIGDGVKQGFTWGPEAHCIDWNLLTESGNHWGVEGGGFEQRNDMCSCKCYSKRNPLRIGWRGPG